MFFEIYNQLCRNIGKSANKVAKDLSIASGTVSEWKKGRIPQNSTLLKIAEYFDVSVDYLLGNTDEKNTPNTVSSIEGIDLTQSEQEIIQMLRKMDRDQLLKAVLELQKIISDHEDQGQK